MIFGGGVNYLLGRSQFLIMILIIGFYRGDGDVSFECLSDRVAAENY